MKQHIWIYGKRLAAVLTGIACLCAAAGCSKTNEINDSAAVPANAPVSDSSADSGETPSDDSTADSTAEAGGDTSIHVVAVGDNLVQQCVYQSAQAHSNDGTSYNFDYCYDNIKPLINGDLNIINQAQRYVYIYTPYFAVGETMLEALKAAAKRGVDVRLVLPGIPDKKLVFRLTRSYYVPLLRAGVRIYEFTPGFLHAKCYVSDDRAAVVGSINMDYRSLFLHFECGALLLYNSQVIALRDDVLRTLPECREVQLADCRTSLAGTLLDSVLRLLSPLM